jgi:hypothetical protein
VSAFFARVWAFIDKLMTMVCQGAIIKAAGDDDEFDVDPKTGKPRKS